MIYFTGRLKADVRAHATEKAGRFHYYFQNAAMDNEIMEVCARGTRVCVLIVWFTATRVCVPMYICK